MASTSVLIWWGNVSCIELNSDLLGYTIHYSSKGEGDDWNTINMVGSINTYNITGLTPYTNYSVKVAAMNTLGDLGPYSGTVTVQTLEDSKSVQTLVHFLINYISWQFTCKCSQTSVSTSLVPRRIPMPKNMGRSLGTRLSKCLETL